MKRFLYHITLLCLLAATVAGCGDPTPAPKPDEPTQKTVIAYFFGTSLSYYLARNVRMMEQAVSTGEFGNNRLIIFYQTSSSTAEIREISYDDQTKTSVTEVLETIELPSELDARSFTDFFSRMLDYAPAQSYSAIFLGHSTAWLPKNTSSPAVRTYGLDPTFVPSFEKMPGAAVTRHIGESNVNLDINELAAGLGDLGVKFDCLYFDVCFMSSLEAAYELRNTTHYLIGSPCEIMGYGSPYDRILKPLAANDYKSVCEEYVDFYENYDYQSGCITTIDCTKLDAVADVVKRMNAAPTAEGFDILDIQAYEGRSASGNYAGHWFYDAEDYYLHICADKGLTDEFKARLSEALPYRYHTDSYYSAYNSAFNAIYYYSGISLTPDEKCIDVIGDSAHRKMLQFYNPYLKMTGWYKATH